MDVKRVVVMASGRGSNFAAICEAVQKKKLPKIQIVGLVSNKSSAPALDLAKQYKIPVHVVESSAFVSNGKLDREKYEAKLTLKLESLKPDLICLAGYMLLLGKELVTRWQGKIINIHPSLLPQFKGLHAHQQALDAKAKWTGCTVHFVTPEMDEGPIIVQTKISVEPNDTEDTLSERLLPIEHQTYVEALKILSEKDYRPK